MIETVTVGGHEFNVGDTWMCVLYSHRSAYITFKATSMVVTTDVGTEEVYYMDSTLDLKPIAKMECYDHPDFQFASGVVYNVGGREIITGGFVTIDGMVVKSDDFKASAIISDDVKII